MNSIDNVERIQRPLRMSKNYQRMIILMMQQVINNPEYGATEALCIISEDFYTTPKELLKFLLFFALKHSRPIPGEIIDKADAR